MNNIVMSRVDARLVHGQIAVRWSKVTHAEQIIVVDDKTAKDDFLSEVLLLAAPPGIETIIKFVDDAVATYTGEGFGSKNTILIFPNVETAKRSWDAGIKFESLNVGQQPKAPGRIRVNNTVQLSQQDINDLKEMDAAGIDIYFHPTPEDLKTDLSTVVRRFEEIR